MSALADIFVSSCGMRRKISFTPGTYREIDTSTAARLYLASSGTYDQETLVTVELHPRGNNTELVLTHERLPDASSAGKHEEGWQDIVRKLAAHLNTAEE